MQHNNQITFLDVAAAIAWVQANTAVYGGDPARVALLDHPAGAGIVSDVAVTPIYLRDMD